MTDVSHVEQPKLVINNIEVLRNAILLDENSSVSGSMYHDSLIWRIIALGANERCIPVVLVTSDRWGSFLLFVCVFFVNFTSLIHLLNFCNCLCFWFVSEL